MRYEEIIRKLKDLLYGDSLFIPNSMLDNFLQSEKGAIGKYAIELDIATYYSQSRKGYIFARPLVGEPIVFDDNMTVVWNS